MLSAAGITVRPPMKARQKRRKERSRRNHAGTTRPSADRVDDVSVPQTVQRLAYTRRQAAEALGVSISTIDRRVVPAIDSVKTLWGQRLIPVDELERFMREHLERGRRTPTR